MTVDRKLFSAVFVDRNAEVVLLHQISKSRKKINEQFTTINVKEKEKEKETLTSNPTKNENKWSVVSGQWKVDSVKFGANKTFVFSLPFTPSLTPSHSPSKPTTKN